MKKVKVLIEKGADGTFGAYMPGDELPYGVIGDGSTVEEAISDFLATYEGMKEIYAKDGKPFEEAEFSFSYDVPSFLEYYGDMLSYKGLAKLVGISPVQLSQYISGYRKPSPKTTEKIQRALHGLGKELSQIRLI